MRPIPMSVHSGKRAHMAVAALKLKPIPEVKTYHATMLVTRAEEWCVEGESPEEARQLLAAGLGHRRKRIGTGDHTYLAIIGRTDSH
jgi:hypothetical protein